jgi:RNA polymerase sigma-70 factor, ECF subfamily
MAVPDAPRGERPPEGEPNRAAERAARLSYGKLVAILSARSRDIAASEDALSSAFLKALETWPQRGIPDNPEAWLLTVARRNELDGRRANAHAADAAVHLALIEEERRSMQEERLADERLKLIFACAHPAIDEGVRAPLILQTVLGIDAARIASAFLVAPNTMGVRLSRAKDKISRAGIAFAIPEPEQLADRAQSVLEAFYAAYTLGRDAADAGDGTGPSDSGLALEALWLASLAAQLLPRLAEAHGLFALILAGEARRRARRGQDGGFVPIGLQDTALWDRRMAADCETALRRAASLGAPGRFQIEAAIQCVHLDRARTGLTDWQAISELYERLCQFTPAIGARLGLAVALKETGRSDAALGVLDAIASERISQHQPYWAVRAEVWARLGRGRDARDAYGRAIALADDDAVRRFLAERRDRLPA